MSGTVYALLQRYMSGFWKDLSKKFNNGSLSVATATKTPNSDNPLLESTTSFSTSVFTGMYGFGTEKEEDGQKIAGSTDSQEMYFLCPISNLLGLTFQQFDDLCRTPDVALTIAGQPVQLSDITNDDLSQVAVVTARRVQTGGR